MKGTGGIYAVTIAAAFVSSLGLALIIKAAGASGVGAGIGWGVVVWIAIGAMTTLTTGACLLFFMCFFPLI